MIFSNFATQDWFALVVFFVAMTYFNLRVETEAANNPSTYALMNSFRRRWMEVLTTRGNRIVDAQIIGILQQSSRFFASGMMIAIGGVIAMMTRPEIMHELSQIFNLKISEASVSLRLFFTALILASGFLKFIWAGRLFGYASILIASIPEENSGEAKKEAARAAVININAARNFNRGLRSIYFALASLCWLLGAIPFILATLLVTYTIWRREFKSHSRAALLENFDV